MAIKFLNTVQVDTDVLYVDTSTSNVGIGTDSPSAKLDVSGSVKANNFVSIQGVDTGNPAASLDELRLSGYGIIGNRGSLYFTNASTTGTLQFGIGGTHASNTKMVIDSTGAIQFNTYGAGTLVTDASGNITVSSGGGVGGPFLPLAGGTMTGVAGVIFPDSFKLNLGTGSDLQISHDGFDSYINNFTGNLNIVNLANDKDIVFKSDDGSGGTTPYLTLDGSTTDAYFSNPGNVGIGTTGPDRLLTLSGSASPYLSLASNTTAGEPSVFFGDTEDDNEGRIVYSNSQDYMSFWTAAAERMRITSAGDVAIGTTGASSARLQVKNSTTNSYNIRFTASDGGDMGGWYQDGSNNSELYLKDGSSVFKALINSNGSSYLNGGNVGINTTGPAYKFTAYGSSTSSEIVASFGSANDINEYTAIGLSGFIAGNDATKAGMALVRKDSFGTGELHFLNNNTVDDSDMTLSDSKMMINTVGNIGIGTDDPDAKLSVVGSTSTNDLIGGSINLATSYGWVIPSGTFSTRIGYYGGNFTLNGIAAENGMEWGLGPFNNRQLLWTTTGSTDDNADGGWNKALTNLDIESPYLSVVYFKRVSSDTSGFVYHGTGNNILNLDGTSNTNPYFKSVAMSDLDQNVWYASIGVIQSNSDSNTTANTDISGLYRLDTGEKVANSATFKFASTGATLSRGHRAYLYYSEDVDVVMQFANPGFYKIDGDQPKLQDIIGDGADDTFWSANGNDIYNDNSGNVGIGTTSPSEKLVIRNGTSNTDIKILAYNNAAGTEATLKFSTIASETNYEKAAIIARNAVASFGRSDMHFALDSAADDGNVQFSDTKMTILNNGNVGIGTTSPAANLHVVGAQNNAGRIYLSDYDNGSGSAAQSLLLTKTGTNSYIYNRDGGDLRLGTNDQFSYVTIKDDGDVGINNTSPKTKLHVSHSTGTAPVLGAPPTSAMFGATNFGTLFSTISSSGKGIIQQGRADGSATAYSLLLNPLGGNVGIGTDSPGEKLEVAGNATFQGTCTATNFILSSDKTLKDKIKNIETKHVDVEWKNFELISEPGVKRSGVIAQELEEKHPEFIRTDKDGLKSVAYIDLLITKIAELEARLDKAGL